MHRKCEDLIVRDVSRSGVVEVPTLEHDERVDGTSPVSRRNVESVANEP
jgi:hypothetical protein